MTSPLGPAVGAHGDASGVPESFTARLFPELARDIRLRRPGKDQAAAYWRQAWHWTMRSSFGARVGVSAVHATTKSAVFRVRRGDQVTAVKVFHQEDAFRRELLNARLLAHDPVFLRLLGWERESQTLEYEWLPSVGLPSAPEEYMRHLARVHTAALRLPRAAADIVRSLAAASDQRITKDPHTTAPSAVLCAVADLKPGHCGHRSSRALVQLDLESLAFGGDTVLDVAATASMLELMPHTPSWYKCLVVYQNECLIHGVRWGLEQLVDRCKPAGRAQAGA